MNTYGVDLMGRRRRRRHSAEFKAAVIGECLKPGVSIAAVALHHGLNANMLRKCVIEAEHKLPPRRSMPVSACPQDVAPASPTFVPLALPAATLEGEIRIELQRAGATVSIKWPALIDPRLAHEPVNMCWPGAYYEYGARAIAAGGILSLEVYADPRSRTVSFTTKARARVRARFRRTGSAAPAAPGVRRFGKPAHCSAACRPCTGSDGEGDRMIVLVQ